MIDSCQLVNSECAAGCLGSLGHFDAGMSHSTGTTSDQISSVPRTLLSIRRAAEGLHCINVVTLMNS